mgnify:CR=1 FL=1
MLLFKKILLFILSLFFIILFFIASSTSYAKSEYNAETLEKNVKYNKENEEILDNCINDLISYKKSRFYQNKFNQKYLAYKVS